MTLIKRLTIVASAGRIEHVFYPVFPPDKHAEEVIAWLKAHRTARDPAREPHAALPRLALGSHGHRIVRLGSPRHPKEGLRIGTVRRPPRGVPKAEFASRELVRRLVPDARAERRDDEARPGGARRRRSGRRSRGSTAPRWPSRRRARRSTCWPRCRKTSDFSVGCYCEDEAHCHRSVLRALLADRGATIASEAVTSSYAGVAKGLADLEGSQPVQQPARRRRRLV